MKSRTSKQTFIRVLAITTLIAAVVVVPEIALAQAPSGANQGFKGQESNWVSQMVTIKNVILGLAFVVALWFGVSGVMSLNKASKDGDRADYAMGWKKIGIGALAASLTFLLALFAGTMTGDANSAMQEQRSILK